MQKPGSKMGVRVLGTNSVVNMQEPEHEAKSQLQKMGLKFSDDIDLYTGDDKWQIYFNPNDRSLMVTDSRDEMLLRQYMFTRIYAEISHRSGVGSRPLDV